MHVLALARQTSIELKEISMVCLAGMDGLGEDGFWTNFKIFFQCCHRNTCTRRAM
jgi:hypothetical protein